MSENVITKPEKTKNPKRVEQGKRLAAISRESKERKRQQQEKFFESSEPQGLSDQGNKILFGIGIIGAAFLAYKIFFDSKDASGTFAAFGYRVSPYEAVDSDEVRMEEEREAQSDPVKSEILQKPSFEPFTMD